MNVNPNRWPLYCISLVPAPSSDLTLGRGDGLVVVDEEWRWCVWDVVEDWFGLLHAG